MRKRFVFIIILLCSQAMKAQLPVDSVQFQSLFPYHRNAWTQGANGNSSSPTAVPLRFAFRFYKRVFSSFDTQSCAFSPSCSSYGVQAVQKNGIFIGILQTFDRLSRCHTYSQQHYSCDAQQHLIDSIK